MLIGYARTSTLEQVAGFQAQREALRAIGCEKLFEEQTSSVGQRSALSAALEFVREGDTLIVTKLDRLARSVRHLGEIVETLEKKRVGLRVLDLGLDTSNATGKLMLNVLGAVAVNAGVKLGHVAAQNWATLGLCGTRVMCGGQSCALPI